MFVSPDVTLFRRSFRTLFPAGFGRVLTRRIGNGHFLTRIGFPGFRNGLRPAIRPGLGGRNLFLSSRRILFRHGRGDGGSLRSDILHDAGRTNNTRADAFSGTGLFGLCRACALSALSCLVFRRRIGRGGNISGRGGVHGLFDGSLSLFGGHGFGRRPFSFRSGSRRRLLRIAATTPHNHARLHFLAGNGLLRFRLEMGFDLFRIFPRD